MKQRTTAGFEEEVGNVLVDGGFLTRHQLAVVRSEARASGRTLRDVLLTDKFTLVTPETLATVLSFQLGVPVVELRKYRIQPEAVTLVPEAVARERNVLPLSVDGDVLRVAMEDPYDVQLLDYLVALTHKRIKPVLPLRGGLKEAIDANYGVEPALALPRGALSSERDAYEGALHEEIGVPGEGQAH